MKYLTFIICLILICANWSEAITVRPYGQKNFEVDFKPVKKVYNTGEQIRFKISANKTFYVYLFNINMNENTGYILFPNILQYNKYIANRQYSIPQKNVVFYSENPGIEKIIMLASTTELNIAVNRYKKKGNFFTCKGDILEKHIRRLYLQPAAKNEQKVIKEIYLEIIDKNQSDELYNDLKGHAAVFVSSHRQVYHAGEIIKITFGADKRGTVYLFNIHPYGKRVILKKQIVSGKNFYQIKIRASLPQGKYTLVALYDKEGDLNNIDNLLNNPSVPYAVYHFRITEY